MDRLGAGGDWGGIALAADRAFHHFSGFLLCAVVAKIGNMAGGASEIWAAYYRMAGKRGDQQKGQKGRAFNLCYQHVVGRYFYTLAMGFDCGGRHIDQRNMADDAAGVMI